MLYILKKKSGRIHISKFKWVKSELTNQIENKLLSGKSYTIGRLRGFTFMIIQFTHTSIRSKLSRISS
jgi:hypothetical protein